MIFDFSDKINVKGLKIIFSNNELDSHFIKRDVFSMLQTHSTNLKVVKEKKATFSKSEPDPFYIKCDVHPWMKTWVLVSDHPYFAVTDAKGNFSIEGIPAGTYEVVCWQEKFGKRTLTAEVTIGEGDTTKDFVFTRPKKK